MIPLLGIDPGPIESGWAIRHEEGKWFFGNTENTKLADGDIWVWNVLKIIGIERIQPRFVPGKPGGRGGYIGKETLETCEWVGRFDCLAGCIPHLIYRATLGTALCGSPRAKDTDIKAAIIDRFGGDAKSVVGTKKNPGPLFGTRGLGSHVWIALGCALVAEEQKRKE